jgi:Cu+-exporting ATPase
MKPLVLVVGIVIGLLTCGFISIPTDQPTQKEGPSKVQAKRVKSVYVCPMHPEVTSTKLGKCPECGMALMKKAPKSIQQSKDKYACPMHPKVTSDKPGECPKCGMDLKKEG